ncbi:MAG: glutamate synthase large subunit [Lachnospiraceae bacterium]|jgi:glutamate synthase (ferredoxin)|nr:glutamate synthase large subunit [Lachnospiraceae bacterium]
MEYKGLYNENMDKDNCGIGAIVNIKGKKTHDTVDNALKIVETLEHRAGKDAEGKTGDGVGISLQISHKFFKKVCKELNIEIGDERDYGVGMFFFPMDEIKRKQAKNIFEVIVEKEGLTFLGWRDVDRNENCLGSYARKKMPYICQGFIKRPDDVEQGIDFDRKLYIIRRIFEQSSDETYVPSLSSRTIVYKGMFLVDQLRTFYLDLEDKDYESAIALVHSRFSTNTTPSWERAHPYRFIVHNGEINTIRGNADKMLAREENIDTDLLRDDFSKILPVIHASGSDSAMFDNALEFFVMSGMDLPLAIMMTIPEPWSNDRAMSEDKKNFYRYFATMMEPWDGPASILFSDGDIMGAVLDRNGLRPSRYYITTDDNLILSSEVGVLPIPPSKVVLKERLHPGKMLLVDTVAGRVIEDEEIKEKYAKKHPYGEWLDANLVSLDSLAIPNVKVQSYEDKDRTRLQRAFGYSYEEVHSSIYKMALTGGEETASMGIDAPLAVLSKMPQNLSGYFKQLFAQVTNPPIDAIRERIVTSTTLHLGKDGNLLKADPSNCRVLKINNPILSETDLLKIKNMKKRGFKVTEIATTYYKNSSLENALDHLFLEATRAIMEGSNIIILTDRGVDEYHIAMPSLLALSGLQQHLVRTKKRSAVSIILETGEPRTVHHFATLLGYGASAINPYLAHESIKGLIDKGTLNKDYYAACDDYNKAIISGIVKIGSKMGISTVQSYQGAKIFEAIGLKKEFIDKYFTNTISRVGGVGIEEIQADYMDRHDKAFDPLGLETDNTLDSSGAHKSRAGKEKHLYNPQTIHMLQQATKNGDYNLFKEYVDKVNEQEGFINLRGQWEFNYPEKGIDISEVESVESIVKRFKTGAMSYGSISKEAHECLAKAMNKLHGKSNSGEGGEDIDRLGTDRNSAIKQVASGRFGVTSRYLVSAREIQIKMAQGAKPGEGGHLPGGKVYPWVAKTRHSTPGVSLISPPPHHDIYSIEDLAQLIYDLKNANRDAGISVKLVSEAGVGTVASGVAKAGAEVILISGHDGGTGAAPMSSIHNAGLPWELGLSETHQTLRKAGLRDRVRLETDGKLMTGKDVAIAAMLGAEEFGFATAPLVSMGCVMMRVCNLDTCPVGVATQNPELRKRFKGKPEYVVNFMEFIAENLREEMARLGVRTIDELVGRSEFIKIKDTFANERAKNLVFDTILNYEVNNDCGSVFNELHKFDFELEKTLDMEVLVKQLGKNIKSAKKSYLEVDVKNVDRSFGTIFGSEITKVHPEGVDDDTFVIKCNGYGGQSFGAFIPKGLTLELIGDSNDYFGKGLSGGKLIVYPPKGVKFKASENIIIGNVALYGATSGKAFINGVAGERFAVRNSGAIAVVEGVGDHGLEYMTGGRVAILGSVGKNLAAGMSGGVAYVLDKNNDLYKHVNKALIHMSSITMKPDIDMLKKMIEEHVSATNSSVGKEILEHFTSYLPQFKKIIPVDYEKMLNKTVQLEEEGYSREEAKEEAFYLMKGGK